MDSLWLDIAAGLQFELILAGVGLKDESPMPLGVRWDIVESNITAFNSIATGIHECPLYHGAGRCFVPLVCDADLHQLTFFLRNDPLGFNHQCRRLVGLRRLIEQVTNDADNQDETDTP